MADVIRIPDDFRRNLPPGVWIIEVPQCCEDGRSGVIHWLGPKWMMHTGRAINFCPWCGIRLDEDLPRREVFYKEFPAPPREGYG